MFLCRLKLLPVLAFCLLLLPSQAYATFHLMQIEQVIGGVNGDTTAQAVQLRMRQGGQDAVGQGKLIVRDQAGNNPVTLIDFSTGVSNGASGDRILIATNAFLTKVHPNATADFSMAAIPSGYLAAGSLTFERDNNSVLWRLSWGGGGYTGSVSGETTNDNDGDFGKFGSALSSTGLFALKFNGAANAASTTNSSDYSVTSGAAVFTNNAGCSFTVDVSGCGSDSDSDGTGDDCDACIDVDGDGAGLAGDCCPLDSCPSDATKTTPGECGCGVADTDGDGDGVADCNDNCLNTPSGESVDGEGCSCSQLDPSGDDDGDGTTNCDDGCPSDPTKTAPGPCGCNSSDTDSDSDGTPDCADGCPNDPNKVAPGTLGCGVAEADADGDLVPDASDNCPNTANSDQADADSDGTGDACESGGPGGGGCGSSGGCAPIGGSMLPLLLLGQRALRRRVRGSLRNRH
jgi:hypothetical protein